MKTRIKATKTKLTPFLKKLVRDKLSDIGKLLRGTPKLIAEVEVGLTSGHHQKGDIYRAEIQIQVPGKIFRAVSKKEDFRSALTDAKNELEKQIRRHKDKKLIRASRK